MYKMFLVFSLFLVTIICCQSNVVESYNYEKDTPVWLKVKIDSISTSDNNYYFGTEVYRYKWNDNFLFEFHIPLSSCMLCELYYYNGSKTNFPNDKTVQKYLNNRTDKVHVWKLPEQ